MELQARVQGSFPFLGKMRKSGDVITAEELAQTTQTVRDALVSQKLIARVGDNLQPEALLPGERSEATAALHDRLDAMDAKMDRVLSLLGKSVPAKKAQPKRAPSVE